MRDPERHTIELIVVVLALIVVCTLLVTAVLIAGADAVEPDRACPPGHSIAQDTEGPYYVYTPNLPAGYSAVWVNDHRDAAAATRHLRAARRPGHRVLHRRHLHIRRLARHHHHDDGHATDRRNPDLYRGR